MNLYHGLWVWKGKKMQVRVLSETNRSENYGKNRSNLGTDRISECMSTLQCNKFE